LFRQFALAGEEEHRAVHGPVAVFPYMAQPHVAAESPRAQPHESNTVALVGIHIGLDLEDEARDLGLGWKHLTRNRLLRLRWRCIMSQRLNQLTHTEILERAAEEHGCEMPLTIGVEVKAWAGALHQLEFGFKLLKRGGVDFLPQARVVQTGESDLGADAFVAAVLEPQQPIMHEIVTALKRTTRPDRPRHRSGREREPAFDLVDQ